MDLNEQGFRFAMTIEDYLNPDKIKNESKYVRWVFRLWKKENGVKSARLLDFHPCTDDDYDQFYPVQKYSIG